MAIDPRSLVSGVDMMPDEQIGLARIRMAQDSDQFNRTLNMQEATRKEALAQRQQQMQDKALDDIGKLVAVDYSKVYQQRDREEVMGDVEKLYNDATSMLINDAEFKKNGTLSWSARSELDKRRQSIESKVALAEKNQEMIANLSKVAVSGAHVDKQLALTEIGKLVEDYKDKPIQERYNTYSSFKMPMKQYPFEMKEMFKHIQPVYKKDGTLDEQATKQRVYEQVESPGVYEKFNNWKGKKASILNVDPDNFSKGQWVEDFANAFVADVKITPKQPNSTFISYTSNAPDAVNLQGKRVGEGREFDVSFKKIPFSGEVKLPDGRPYTVQTGWRSKVIKRDDGTYGEVIVAQVPDAETAELAKFGLKVTKEGVEIPIESSADAEQIMKINKIFIEGEKKQPKGTKKTYKMSEAKAKYPGRSEDEIRKKLAAAGYEEEK